MQTEVTPDVLPTHVVLMPQRLGTGHGLTRGARVDCVGWPPERVAAYERSGILRALPLADAAVEAAKQRLRVKRKCTGLLAEREPLLKEQAEVQARISEGERVVAEMETAIAALPLARKALKGDANRSVQVAIALERIAYALASLEVQQ